MAVNFQESNIAFAGVCQAAALVNQLARTGNCDDTLLTNTLSSVIITDPSQTIEVYGGYDKIELGYKTLIAQLTNASSGPDSALTRYMIGLMALERKLTKRNDILNMLGERISQVKRQTHHYALTDEQILSNMASIYVDLISPLGTKIQIAGTSTFLQQPLVRDKIRALLLSGVRSAVLWRQTGGKRRYVVINRKHMVEQAKQQLARI
ncbi:MAG: high frequency lysogenization protein [Moritella sp.]